MEEEEKDWYDEIQDVMEHLINLDEKLLPKPIPIIVSGLIANICEDMEIYEETPEDFLAGAILFNIFLIDGLMEVLHPDYFYLKPHLQEIHKYLNEWKEECIVEIPIDSNEQNKSDFDYTKN